MTEKPIPCLLPAKPVEHFPRGTGRIKQIKTVQEISWLLPYSFDFMVEDMLGEAIMKPLRKLLYQVMRNQSRLPKSAIETRLHYASYHSLFTVTTSYILAVSAVILQQRLVLFGVWNDAGDRYKISMAIVCLQSMH